jgi:phosphate acyltransferase
LRIGIDLLGSDCSCQDLFSEVIAQLEKEAHSALYVFYLPKNPSFNFIPSSKYEIVFVENYISMEESPVEAIKKKPKASLPWAVKSLHKKEIDALVTVGNTGALTACATLFCSKLKNVQRPALVARLPTDTQPLSFLDVGATIDYSSKRLFKVAQLGVLYHHIRYSVEKPTLGLLNIGVEPKKGTKQMQSLYEILSAHQTSIYNFSGNIEARDLFKTKIDVVLTDGFTGNIVLKVSEGLAMEIISLLKKEERTERFLYRTAPGALMLGIEEVILKCHGEGSAEAFVAALKEAEHLVKHKVLEKLTNLWNHS